MSARDDILYALRHVSGAVGDELPEAVLDQHDAEVRRLVADMIDAEVQFVGGPDSEAGRVLRYLADRLRTAADDQDDEKDTRGVPRTGESTRHSRPCEYPEALPCLCPVRPRALPDARRSAQRLALFFAGVRRTGSAVAGD